MTIDDKEYFMTEEDLRWLRDSIDATLGDRTKVADSAAERPAKAAPPAGWRPLSSKTEG